MEWRWLFRGHVTRVIDGDTIEVYVDRGYDSYQLMRLRLRDIDTPELRPRKAGRTEEDLEAERELAAAARDWLAALLVAPPVHVAEPGTYGKAVVFATYKQSFDRYVADVWLAEEDWGWDETQSLNARLVEEGHAVWMR